jgi:hypothetical protein
MPPDNPQQALRSLADGWLNYSYDSHTDRYDKTDQSTRGANNNLIDSLADKDGYVLPFSYAGCPTCTNTNGAQMGGTSSAPSFDVPAYTGDDVGATDPTTTGPADLQAEIASIHAIFTHVPIIVIGHSNGGLIAEQWWLNYGQGDPDGVIQVFALDSPLNGVGAAGVCVTGLCGGAVGPILAAVYATLWAHQDQYDPIALAVDARDHLFTAIADLGDPLYDFADYPSSQFLTGVKNIGLISQLYWTEPGCTQSGYDLSSSACTATGQAVLNPCGNNLDDGTGPDFGVPTDLWLHSMVKNCSGTISDVLAWIGQTPPPPTLSAPAPVTTVVPRPSTPPPSTPPPSTPPPSTPPPSTPPPSSAPSSAHAGLDSPQDAVTGYYDNALAGQWAQACEYIEPSSRRLCVAATSGLPAATGTTTVRGTFTVGSKALVEVTGHICAPQQPCVSNADPTSGMPRSRADFPSVYAADVAGATSGATSMSPVACLRKGTDWYLNLG